MIVSIYDTVGIHNQYVAHPSANDDDNDDVVLYLMGHQIQTTAKRAVDVRLHIINTGMCINNL